VREGKLSTYGVGRRTGVICLNLCGRSTLLCACVLCSACALGFGREWGFDRMFASLRPIVLQQSLLDTVSSMIWLLDTVSSMIWFCAFVHVVASLRPILLQHAIYYQMAAAVMICSEPLPCISASL
jgi:hypothetical protein